MDMATQPNLVTEPAGASPGAVLGGVRLLLRLEGLVLAAAAAAFYAHQGGSWWLFAALFLAPDVSFAGYLSGPRVGALVYNAVHNTLAPAALLAIGLVAGQPLVVEIATIWLAHIGVDRLAGYGLKYVDGFGFTHLGRIGRAAA
ncbi:DUF4260 domain-containing protein [Bradyrhizobium ontarionense]|uniref:DUF4260 domain-containing protein n=1 Tax=Bradyrhizobium ontarionense TaxID=2898149 RepID=A0ABY3RGG6_9BRAD|nr:DUF4260 domain-containing protein [Bradyrhizobium sp. A19]UFZ06403.1 DUF4260 domain-containing protein [Bradyrhizobium sp. A19]